MAAPVVAKRTVAQLWKEGWNKIPEVMGAGLFGVAGLFLHAYGCYSYSKNDKGNHRYKVDYLVFRPEDPRVDRIITYEDSPPKTDSRGKR